MAIDWGKFTKKPPEKPPEKPKAEPKMVTHKFDSALGWCPECSKIEARDFGDIMKRLPDVRKFIDEQLKDYAYECATCHLPLAKNAEDAKALNGCPWCRGQKAVKRGK